MKYVVIGFGWKCIFTVSDRCEAIEKAFELANEVHVDTWLLYDYSLNLLADCQEGVLR